MWSWNIIDPRAATNHLINPSFESSTTGWTLTGSPTASTTQQYRGAYSLHYSAGTNDLAVQGVTLPSETYAFASAWVYLVAGTVGVKVTTASSGGTVLGTATATGTGWQRVSCLVTLAGNTTVYYKLFATGTSEAYFDACQVEDGNTLTSYIDGMEPGCLWKGAMHLSPSFRPANSRQGGASIPLSTYFTADGMQGWGRATHSNVMLPFGLQGGSVYQRSVKQSRVATITGHITGGTGGMDDLHNSQAALGMLLGNDRVYPQKPVRLQYLSGVSAGTPLYTDAVYEGGLEFNGLSGLTLTQVPLRFHAPDPAMQEDKEQYALVEHQLISSDSTMYYKSSSTQAFAAVPSSALSVVLCGEWTSDGKLWLGGTFTGTYTRLCVFDPVAGTLSAPPFTIGPTTGQVNAIQQAGNYLWIGGTFAAVSGHSFSYLVRYNMTTGIVDKPIAVTGAVATLAHDPLQDILYVGGSALGVIDNNLFEITGASGASPTAAAIPWSWPGSEYPVYDMCLDPAGNLYVLALPSLIMVIYQGLLSMGNFTEIGDGDVTSAANPPQAHSMAWGPDGYLYVVGGIENMTPGSVNGLVRWNGSSWQSVGQAVDVATYGRSIAFDSQGRAHIGGLIYSGDTPIPGSPQPAGYLTHSPTGGYVIYEGAGLHVAPDVWLTYGGIALANAALVFVNPADDSVLVIPNTITAAIFAAPISVTYTGTAPAPVRFAIPTSTTAVVSALANITTGQSIYFVGLLLIAGETLYIETTPGAARVYSNLRADLSSFVATGSDLGSFVLVEGVNQILAHTTIGTTYITWRDRHYGIDGAGSGVNALETAG